MLVGGLFHGGELSMTRDGLQHFILQFSRGRDFLTAMRVPNPSRYIGRQGWFALGAAAFVLAIVILTTR